MNPIKWLWFFRDQAVADVPREEAVTVYIRNDVPVSSEDAVQIAMFLGTHPSISYGWTVPVICIKKSQYEAMPEGLRCFFVPHEIVVRYK